MAWKSIYKKDSFKDLNLYEKSSIKNLDRIIAARPDIGVNFPEDKTTVVVNSPVITSIDQIAPADIKAEKPIVIYAGGITKIRGIKELIEAMALLDGRAELWMFGSWDDSKFEAKCRSLEDGNMWFLKVSSHKMMYIHI